MALSRDSRPSASGKTRRALLAAPLVVPALLPAQEAAAQPRPANRPAAPRAPRPAGTPASSPVGPVDTLARQVLIIDFETDAVLLEKAADERMTPSSMSKLMTMYVVFDLLKQGRIRMDQTFTVSETAWRMGGSRMFVEVGSQVSIENLTRGVIIQSGNDACVVLAEGIAGSERQFVELMNQKARELGLTNSTFRNATGWPDPEHRMTCRDLARLAKRLIHDFPEYYRFYSERNFRWNNVSQDNRNPLLSRMNGADGMKTGHTEEAGYGLVGSVKQGDRRLVMVLNGLPTQGARIEESVRLMEWGFGNFENVVLFRAQDAIEQVPVHLGSSPTVPLVGGRDVVVTLPRTWRNTMQARLRYEAPVPAPVMRGQELGRIEIGGSGVPPITLPLYAGADVEKLGMLARIPGALQRLLGGG
ncbi:D-alanyl-D-alanine carboxypeptidase [Rhodovarius crocodyli]|uniref:serine-type D-Ala-D-Ala carboxypeptidase n=1 Tax=Rhodovarius crocodyli TaxID=1979269 RepID=A0A437MEB3_9PROT|nr:D-alanyl-D-alanine carboxypeptidase family protein [Rhodovarius crocodyli]RVT95945.1 D-alanyl-D-alanine carboxypeptidase [Rhodovarius crocodyli]